MTGSRRAQRRERWAQQEDERRRTAYRASLAQWRRRDAELRRLLTAATTTQPARDGDWSLWLHTRRGEVVYWAAGGAGAIEAPYVPRLRPPHYREFTRAEGPAGGPPIDTGQVAVTDQRVVFQGRTRREWAYAKLIGMAHTVAGQTWLLVTSRTEVSGVAPPRATTTEFRLHLALAMADRAGERDTFVAQLAEQLDRHQRAEPQPPASATADRAPWSSRWGPHRRLVTAVTASAALVSFFAIGTALAGNDRRPDSFSASTESPAVQSPPPAPAPESPTPGTEVTAAPRGVPVRQAVPPQQLPPPPPPPSPTPSPPPTADTVDPWFPSCDEANQNGYGPYLRDQDPEYYWYRDRNRDGVVCRP
jgi:hypothetical protein